MKSRLRSFHISLFLLFCSLISQAQSGHPYLINYGMYSVIDKKNYAIVQGPNDILFIANSKGIITFDGDRWDFIDLEKPALTLAFDTVTNQLYTGCRDNYGVMHKNNQGVFEYQSLSPAGQNLGSVTQIEITTDAVYFYSNKSVSSVARFGNKPKDFYVAEEDDPFLGFTRSARTVFVITQKKGICKLLEGEIDPLPLNLPFKSSSFLFSILYDRMHSLIGTRESNLFLFDGEKFKPYTIGDVEYLTSSILSTGLSLAENQIALGTLMGGCLIIDKKTRQTIHTVNYNTGLPDDEVFSLGQDHYTGLWISHSYGLTRIDLGLPITNFQHYPGIKGNFTSVLNFNSKLYVGTSEGVYLLKEIKEYSSKEITVRINPANQSSGLQNQNKEAESSKEEVKIPENSTPSTSVDEGKLSRRELRRLKKQQDSDNQEAPKEKTGLIAKIFQSTVSSELQQNDKRNNLKIQQQQFRKKKIYSLQSVSHQFEKIPGIDEKCRQLTATSDRILVATNNGLYEILNGKSKSIIKNEYIHFISSSIIPDRYYVGTSEGVYSLLLLNGKWEIENKFSDIQTQIYSVTEKTPGDLWMGGDNILFHVTTDVLGKTKEILNFAIDSKYSEQVQVKTLNDQIFLFLSSGVYMFQNDSLVPYSEAFADFFSVPVYHFSDKGIVWMRQKGSWKSFSDSGVYTPKLDMFLNLFDEIQYISTDTEGNLWIVDNNNQLIKAEVSELHRFSPDFNLYIQNIKSDNELLVNTPEVEIDYEKRGLIFRIVAPYFMKVNTTQYQYWIEGLRDNWSEWNTNPALDIGIIPPGKYTLHVKARNIFGKVSEEKILNFRIKPAFWQTPWFIGLCVLILIAIVWLVNRARIEQLKRQNDELEQKVAERTEEILQQKEEIEAQRDEIEAQKNELEKQRDQIFLQNKEITDSIHYAKRIQTAVLPSMDWIKTILPNSFIYFKPRDIVSGDFYWLSEKNGKIILVAADCTGHGVPGAFMSMLGVSFLNEIVNLEDNPDASFIMNRLRDRVKKTLSQGGHAHETKDGMDMALCIIDSQESVLEYGGAFNPMYLIRENQLYEYKADKMPIGIFEKEIPSFTPHKIPVKKGDIVYIFSDGYMDQFGGPEGRKLMSKPFKNFLLSIHQSPMEEQKQKITEFMDQWRGDNPQVDDMLVMGYLIQ